MPTFSAKSALNAVVTLVSGLPGIEEVRKGVPAGPDRDVAALVAMGPRTLVDKATGLLLREMAIIVAVGVRVAGDEAAAEDVLLDLEDALIDAWVVDRTLGGTVDECLPPEDRSGDPEYQLILGQEFRIRVYHLNVRQRRAFS